MTEFQVFLIDFDSIFDTRLGTLFHNQPERASEILDISYFTREMDAFKEVPSPVFSALYEKRTFEIVKKSIKTPMVDFLLDFVRATYKNSINGYEHKAPKIIFNTYPYSISEEDAKPILDIFIDLTAGLCQFEFIHLPYAQLSPQYLRDQVGALSLYNYPQWLEIHSENENLKKCPISSVTLFGPKIYFKPLTIEEKNFLIQNKINPFEQIEKLSAPFIRLKLLDIAMYCADLLPKTPGDSQQ